MPTKDEEGAEGRQRWLNLIEELGMSSTPFAVSDTIWRPEDNAEAAKLGFMIGQGNIGSEILEIYGGIGTLTGAAAAMEYCKEHCETIPVCAKAIAVMTAQKFKFPRHKFLYEKG